jgi:hypothetical protein
MGVNPFKINGPVSMIPVAFIKIIYVQVNGRQPDRCHPQGLEVFYFFLESGKITAMESFRIGKVALAVIGGITVIKPIGHNKVNYIILCDHFRTSLMPNPAKPGPK